MLHAQYHLTGNSDIGHELIMVRRAAVSAVGDQDRAMANGRLCRSLLLRFARTGNLATLREAVQAGRKAAIQDRPERGGHLVFLGHALLRTYEETGDRAILDEAAQVFEEAIGTRLFADVSAVDAWRGLARVRARAGDRKAALAAMEGRCRDGHRLIARTPALGIEYFALAGRPAREARRPRRRCRPARPPEHWNCLKRPEDDCWQRPWGPVIRSAGWPGTRPARPPRYAAVEAEHARIEAESAAADPGGFAGLPGLSSPPGATADGGGAGRAARLSSVREFAQRREQTEAERAALLRQKSGRRRVSRTSCCRYRRRSCASTPVPACPSLSSRPTPTAATR